MFGIVVNPVSGAGQGKRLAEEAMALVHQAGDEGRIYPSTEVGGMREATAKAITEGCSSIAVVGGDGSLSEAVRALYGTGAELLLIPGGTGNDLARSLLLPKDPILAFRAQLYGEPGTMDLGLINGMPFLNVSGSGFDVSVLERTEALKAVYPGGKAYRKAVLREIRHFRPFAPEILVDGKPLPREEYTICEIANGRYFGGGMKVAPSARVDDGFFEIILVPKLSKLGITLFLSLFIAGAHVAVGLARCSRAKRVTLRMPGMTVNIDGQLMHMDEANYEISEGALRIRRPKKDA